MDYADAIAYLDAHINYDRTGRIESPTLERMQRLMAVMGDPQHTFPVIHVTGTNGKGSTVAIISRVLSELGLSVGTFTSPHLERINERIGRNGLAISDEEFAEMIAGVADVEVLAGVRPSHFELLTAAAYRWFSDVAVDVAVIEVGLLGRWDATNVANGKVAVVTNVELDHTEFAGPTRADIATEKAGIIKPGSVLVLGETEPELAAIFRGAGPDRVYERDLDFACERNDLALGGRVLDLRTPAATYPDVFLSLNGRHQGDNAAVALCAVEAFFDTAIDPEIVSLALGDVRMPGRFEVLGHQPLVILDGAHNVAGADVAAMVMDEDFDPVGDRIYVVGFLRGRDPAAMLRALGADEARLIVCCTPASPRGIPAEETALAAKALGCEVAVVDDVAGAVSRALDVAGEDDAILVTGSLYVVGAARTYLLRHRR
jgi:dihydrofolate synthase/folylpolyglutamate synthase